ncbi:hypothetical protein DYB31_012866 [Aphanomyces astaci]|uniref:Uncharacterized protein n=1 Tax=Aphanomyces astaci TaxID=112090 RepID=A0A397EW34_APHAT|nr:hypothetical protein DYB31_012866 [Aphanomyces astaci]
MKKFASCRDAVVTDTAVCPWTTVEGRMSMAPPALMQRTGRKVLDRNGRVVDEMKEDSIYVRLHDPNNTDRTTNPYQPILRSNFRL